MVLGSTIHQSWFKRYEFFRSLNARAPWFFSFFFFFFLVLGSPILSLLKVSFFFFWLMVHLFFSSSSSWSYYLIPPVPLMGQLTYFFHAFAFVSTLRPSHCVKDFIFKSVSAYPHIPFPSTL